MDVHLESNGARWEGVEVVALTGKEGIGQLFRFDLDVACDHGEGLPPGLAAGDRATLVASIEGEEVRRVHGALGPIRDRLDPSGNRRTYGLTLVPRAARLALVETQEVYLDMTVPEIVGSKLDRHGFVAGDWELRLLKAYPRRELVVQYKESDLAFVLRLAEHLGISVFFEHGEDGDRMIFTDHPAGFRPAPGAEEIRFQARGEASDVFSLEVTAHPVPTTYVVQDYNYRKPQLELTAHHAIDEGAGGGVVEYGSHVKTPDEAKEIARTRAEERQCRARVYEGRSALPTLCAGRRARLLDHPRLQGPEDLLLVEVEHAATFPIHGAADVSASYTNTFTALPGSVVYRPERRTPRPRIHGFVTGVVQPGPGGQIGGVARLDGEGRYTVELHFDTAVADGRRASHPVRMAQPFAGTNHGMHFPLRPGAEVIVAFADGDPDRPIILGSVPNAVAPSAVNAASADRHRIVTASGALIEIRDRQ